MKKIEAVIFDWAGTTVDYGSFAPVGAFINAFSEHGIIPTNAEVREPMGMLKRDHVKYMLNMPRINAEFKSIHGRDFTESDIDAIYEKSELSILQAVKDYAEPKPFVLDEIAKLRARGIKIGSTTGYTRAMVDLVIPVAKENGYSPDACFTSTEVSGFGRPYPYMIFKNMETLNISSVNAVIKVGDTTTDIKEGLTAGVITVGIIEGSSAMGLTETEYNALSNEQKQAEIQRVIDLYRAAGAHYIINNMSELCNLIDTIEQ